ncbi:MAG: hypothetical protein AUI08_09185 [Gemmatimonadetes bacterium 13_2_20CM_2_65_7]|nr:MAG: hypothetical protein AUI08_09185 [Gemmatimonadetes bacterium 13_2_20CM_2_65_7]OLC40183.1 MAG: hypothetical protein AUH75_08125 [Gemmatimonadetes bacterium 13_1_40CM_4_65_7]OLD00594.1 MAG: hypothetical protein AUI89_06365 [Gemmatimonadetes bacterium 13_1_40CM_3_65_8]
MLALLLTLSVAVQDSGAFVVRLGTDTVALEQYTRTATQLRGEYVVRTPRSLHRIYTADLNPDGTVRRWELVTHNIGGGPGPMETKASVDFSGDTAVMVSPQGDGTVTSKFAVPRGTFPFLIYGYGLLEHMGRWARATGKDSVRFTALASANQTSGGYIRKRGGDTLVFMLDEGQLAGVGPFTFRLDRQGHLTWLTGKGSTLQVEVQRVASVPMAQATQSFANRPLGQLSPRDTTRANLQGVDVWIDYSRPQKRGREIFGNIVPWNAVWRTGANAATQLSAAGDIVIGDGGAAQVVRAGKYTLWTLPTPTGWKVIINKQTGQWGTEYNRELDLIRIDAKVETLATPVEQLTISFEPANKGSILAITWDRTRVLVPVSKHWP